MSAQNSLKRGRYEFGKKPGSEMLKASEVRPEQLGAASNERRVKAKIIEAVKELRTTHYSSDLLDSLVRGVRNSDLSKLVALLTAVFVFSSSLEKTNPENQTATSVAHIDDEKNEVDGHILKIIHSLNDESVSESPLYSTVVGGPETTTPPIMDGSNETKSAEAEGKEITDIPLSEESALVGNEYARTYEPKGEVDVSGVANEIHQLLEAGAKKVTVNITGHSSFEHGAGTKKEEQQNLRLSGKRGAKGERELVSELQRRGVDMSRVEITTKVGGPRIRVDDRDYSEQEAVQHLMSQLGKTEKQIRSLIKKYNRNPKSVDTKTKDVLDIFLAKNRGTVFKVTSVGDVVLPSSFDEVETVKIPPATTIAPKPIPITTTPAPIPHPSPSAKLSIGGALITALPAEMGGDNGVEWYARDPEEEGGDGDKAKRDGKPDGKEKDENGKPGADKPPVVLGSLPTPNIEITKIPDIDKKPETIFDRTPDLPDRLPDVPDDEPLPPPDKTKLPPLRSEISERDPGIDPDKKPNPDPVLDRDFDTSQKPSPIILPRTEEPPTRPEPPRQPLAETPRTVDNPPVPPILPDQPPYIPPYKPPYIPVRPVRPDTPPPPPPPPEEYGNKYSGQQSVERQPMKTPTRTAKKDLLGGQHEGPEKQTGRGRVVIGEDGHAKPLSRREFLPNVEDRHRGDRGIGAKIKDQWKKIARKFKRDQRSD